MKRIMVIAVIIIIAVIGGGGVWYYQANRMSTTQPRVVINGQLVIPVEVADTPAKQAQGLSDRQLLPSHSGMLFPYGHAHTPQFWMFRMRFNLDFIWINQNTIVDLHKNVPFPTNGSEPFRVQPRQPITAVLEVNAGFVDQNEIKIGDTVEIFY